MEQRTTRDEWRLWLDYGQGWEHECSEDTFRAVRDQAEAYRINAPLYPCKITGSHRVKIEAES